MELGSEFDALVECGACGAYCNVYRSSKQTTGGGCNGLVAGYGCLGVGWGRWYCRVDQRKTREEE